MIILVRHSDDESDGCTQNHDCELAKNGKYLASSVGKKLIAKYGLPSTIYVSPFRRTIQTMNHMLNRNTNRRLDKIRIVEENAIARYFSSSDKKKPKVDRKTLEKDIPIYESWDEFKKRVDDFYDFLQELDTSDQVIWVVTHVVVYKRLCRHFDHEVSGHISFMKYSIFEYCEDCDVHHHIK